MSPHRSPHQNVLVIMASPQRRAPLVAALKILELVPVEAEDWTQARRLLAGRRPLHLVVSDVEFPDGDWRAALAATQRRPDQAAFLLSTPFTDYGLWSEALWRGAYDLLVEPYSAPELRRIVEGALRTQQPDTAPQRSIAQAV